MNDKPELPKLTEKEAAFVEAYTTHWNGARAVRDAGYDTPNARNMAYEIRAKLHVKAAIDAEIEKQSKVRALTKEKLIENLWLIATADPNELIEYRRVNCRHCYGEGHRHQYTDHEMAVRRADHEKKTRGSSLPGDDDGFDYGGGTGFNRTAEPNPDCPECRGVGEELIIAKDTRDLSPSARALYAGVKVTKEGLQILMHDQLAAQDKLARQFGLYVDRKVLENPDGTGINFAPIMFTPVEPKAEDEG